MDSQILSTKLYLPPPRTNFVPRLDLLRRLDEGLAHGRRLSLISAPAGYGKSILAASWMLNLGRSDSPPARVSWLSLDKDDNDPPRFLSYLIAAVQKLDLELDFQSLLQSPHPPPPAELMTSFINAMAEAVSTFSRQEMLALALDDYHKIHSAYIHDCIQFLLDYAPPELHLVLVTRQDPPLGLSRMRVAGELTEIRAQDLRFKGEEIEQFFSLSNKIELERNWVETLMERTEGWIAGLQLAALSLRNRHDIGAFLDDFRGSNRYLMDYLIDEVLSLQTEDIRQFLLQTSILDRMTENLCQAITGRLDSQEILQQIDQNNLFLIPLDEHREWYRYHHLFSDFLRTELPEEQRSELHRKASSWYEANSFIPEAVQHALASTDYELAADVVERAILVPATWSGGQLGMLLGWLDALPLESLQGRPQLAIRASRAWYLSGQLNRSAQLLDMAEKSLRSKPVEGENLEVSLAHILAYRSAILAIQGQVTIAKEMVLQALSGLPENYLLARARAMDTLGLVHTLSGNPNAAVNAFLAASQVAQEAGVLFLAINACCEAALVQISQGQLSQAESTCRKALQLPGEGSERIPPAGLAWAVLGDIARERNDLEAAERFLADAIRLSQAGGIIDDLKTEYLFLARLRAAQGDKDSAVHATQRALSILQSYRSSPLLGQRAAIEAFLDLSLGNTIAAANWAQEYERTRASGSGDYLREFEDLTLARFLMADERQQDALVLLQEVIEAAREGDRLGVVIEAQILMAKAFWTMGNTESALQGLESALILAQNEGYVRAFVDEGEPIRELLSDLVTVTTDPNLQEYAGQLLAAFTSPATARDPVPLSQVGEESEAIPGIEFIEPLSEQELKILRLLSAGLSNKEIAAEVVIGVGTVKWHVHNIYGKLGVSSRTQAIARAQEAGILK